MTRTLDLGCGLVPRNPFITDESFTLYFDDVSRWALIYGFKGAFKIERQEWHGIHLLTIMRKVPVPALAITPTPAPT